MLLNQAAGYHAFLLLTCSRTGVAGNICPAIPLVANYSACRQEPMDSRTENLVTSLSETLFSAPLEVEGHHQLLVEMQRTAFACCAL